MPLYIRHGNDETTSYYKQDTRLNQSFKQDIITVTQELIKQYGYPDKIYCSPFKRARETLNVMMTLIKCPVFIDSNLSRFFSEKETLNPKVRPSTLKYNPPIQESKQEFKYRADHLKYKGNVWCITHFLIIKRTAKRAAKHVPHTMPFLYHLFI